MKVNIGETYRHKNNPNMGFAKVLEIIPARTGANKHGYKLVKVEWTQSKDSMFGLIKYFKQSDMVKESV